MSNNSPFSKNVQRVYPEDTSKKVIPEDRAKRVYPEDTSKKVIPKTQTWNY